MTSRKEQKGSIALLTVIVVTAILLASGMSLVLVSSDLIIASKDYSNVQRISLVQRTCLEESLSRVKKNDSFTGTVAYNGGQDTCSSLVENDPVNPSIKVLTITGTTDGYSLVDVVHVDISVEPYHIVE